MNAIILNGFMVEILTDKLPNKDIEKIIYKNGNYYQMHDNTPYQIRLTNNHGVRADAHIWIGHHKAGVWRVNPYSRIVVKRAANPDVELVLREEELRDVVDGIIKVEFQPEIITDDYQPPIKKHDQSLCGELDPTGIHYLCKEYTDTVTPFDKVHRICAMNDESYERYIWNTVSSGYYPPVIKINKVDKLQDIDLANVTKIYARLIVTNDKTTAIRKYNMMRETVGTRTSTPIPEPLDLFRPNRPHTCDLDSKFTLSRKYWFDSF